MTLLRFFPARAFAALASFALLATLLTGIASPAAAETVAPDATATQDNEIVEDLEAVAAAAAGSVPVYRFWSEQYKAHFYTTSVEERDKVIRTWPKQWSYEGPRFNAYTSQVAGTVPVYRFWSEYKKAHFYTTSAAERDDVQKRWPDIWAYEGIAYYAYPAEADTAGTLTVERFWSAGFHSHFYTAEAAEAQKVKTTWPDVWAPEGTRFRVLPATQGAPLPVIAPALQWPLKDTWTWSSSTNGFSSWHPGVDMMIGRNTPIYAIADGKVITSTEGAGTGLGVYIEVQHTINGQKVVSRYGHMNYGSRLVGVGATVTAGQKLGGVGDSGNAYGTHLHFELVVNGSKVDPMTWLPNNGAAK